MRAIRRLTSVLDVRDLVSCQQQVSGLLHSEAIVFEDLAREDDVLCVTSRLSLDIS